MRVLMHINEMELIRQKFVIQLSLTKERSDKSHDSDRGIQSIEQKTFRMLPLTRDGKSGR